MGCGCKGRGRMIRSAMDHIAAGDRQGAVERLRVVAASASQDVRVRLASARLKAQTRKRRK